MRTTLILRQIAGGATQPKLPFPNAFTPAIVRRLQPADENWLPSLVNAPITLPPQLIPPQQVDPSALNAVARKLWRTAKSYIQFYKQGYKQWSSNRDIRKVLRRKLMSSMQFANVPGSSSVAMTRSEFQLLIRTKRDSRVMPRMLHLCNDVLMWIVFLVVLVIFGEFTPLIVYLFGSSFLPLTVITPGQLDKRRRKRIDDLDRKRLPIVPRVTPTVEQVKQLQKRTIIHECRYCQRLSLLIQDCLVCFQDGCQYISFRPFTCGKSLYDKSTTLNMTMNCFAKIVKNQVSKTCLLMRSRWHWKNGECMISFKHWLI